jgi:hypothetical protein
LLTLDWQTPSDSAAQRKLRCYATVNAWITEASSIFGFTKIPLKKDGESSRLAINRDMLKKIVQNKLRTSRTRWCSIDEHDAA